MIIHADNMAAINTRLKLLFIVLATTITLALAEANDNEDPKILKNQLLSRYESFKITAENCTFPPSWMFLADSFMRCENVINMDTQVMCNLTYNLASAICKKYKPLASTIEHDLLNYGTLQKTVDEVCLEFTPLFVRYSKPVSNCIQVCSDMRLVCEFNFIALTSYDAASPKKSNASSNGPKIDKKEATASSSPDDKVGAPDNNQIQTTEVETGSKTVKPQVETGSQTVKPQVETGSQTVKPQVETGSQTMKPQVETGSQTVRPQVETGSQTVKPQVETGSQTVKPQLESGSQTVKPQVGTGSQTVKPQVETGSQTGKPQVETGSQTVKTQVETGSQTVKPQVETGSQTVKPQVETDSQTVTPQVESGSQTVKPQVETGSQTVKPQVETGSQTVKPQLETGSQTVKPQVETDSQTLKPQVETGSQTAKPPEETGSEEDDLQGETVSKEDKLQGETGSKEDKLQGETGSKAAVPVPGKDAGLEGSQTNNKPTDTEIEANRPDGNKGDDKTVGSKGNIYENQEEIDVEKVPSSGNFMAYFLTAVVLCIAGYVVFHNKQKIFAFIIEGRSTRQRRRANGSGEYKKLQSNVEEVMPSLDKSTSARNFIY